MLLVFVFWQPEAVQDFRGQFLGAAVFGVDLQVGRLAIYRFAPGKQLNYLVQRAVLGKIGTPAGSCGVARHALEDCFRPGRRATRLCRFAALIADFLRASGRRRRRPAPGGRGGTDRQSPGFPGRERPARRLRRRFGRWSCQPGARFPRRHRSTASPIAGPKVRPAWSCRSLDNR